MRFNGDKLLVLYAQASKVTSLQDPDFRGSLFYLIRLTQDPSFTILRCEL